MLSRRIDSLQYHERVRQRRKRPRREDRRRFRVILISALTHCSFQYSPQGTANLNHSTFHGNNDFYKSMEGEDILPLPLSFLNDLQLLVTFLKFFNTFCTISFLRRVFFADSPVMIRVIHDFSERCVKLPRKLLRVCIFTGFAHFYDFL